jgi:hypothetical protein
VTEKGDAAQQSYIPHFLSDGSGFASPNHVKAITARLRRLHTFEFGATTAKPAIRMREIPTEKGKFNYHVLRFWLKIRT